MFSQVARAAPHDPKERHSETVKPLEEDTLVRTGSSLFSGEGRSVTYRVARLAATRANSAGRGAGNTYLRLPRLANARRTGPGILTLVAWGSLDCSDSGLGALAPFE
jgi:hypothetical protein